MKQYIITPAAGKCLIGKALALHSEIQSAVVRGTVVIVAGTTNGYVAAEILEGIGALGGGCFDRRRFFRGITLPPSQATTDVGLLPGEPGFPGDVIITGGVWQKGKTIFDVADALKEGDVILKGANALDLQRKRAAIYIGHPQGGTAAVALQAVVGRRVRLFLPVGLEKRIHGDLDSLAEILNVPGACGPRLLPVPGQVFTEIDALALLTGAEAVLVAGGGVNGAEGSIRLAVRGNPQQEKAAAELLQSLVHEPLFTIG
jgi:hypothetical protein